MTNITVPAIRRADCARCGTAIPQGDAKCPACGLSLTADTAVLAPPAGAGSGGGDEALIRSALAPEYELLEELGRGGMAIVYRAREAALGRDVAVKVLPVTHSFDTELVDRFQHEARTAARLEHPHIIPIYRVGSGGDGRVSYFVMKYLRGRTLSAVLRERRVLEPAELRRLLREVGGALAYAAEQGVVHRDIKPDNIMLDEGGRFVVADFGIARSAVSPRLTATGMSVGTPRYMSPEQARARELDGRSDIYSLGIVAYECLTGRAPFSGEEAFAILYAHIHSPLPRPALATSEEWELFELIERMTRKNPDERVQNGAELVRLLHALDRRAEAPPAPTATLASVTLTRRALAPATLALLTKTRVLGGRLLVAARRALARGVGVAKRASAGSADLTLAAAGRGRDHARAAWRRARPVLERGRARARGIPAIAWATATPARTGASCIALVTLLTIANHVAHAALHHRSRCPGEQPDGTRPAPSIHLDAPGTHSVGSSIVLHYDVCGFEREAAYTAQVTIARDGGTIRRLLGGPSPVVERFDEQSEGPATRRHRRIDLGALPAGSYSVELVVEKPGSRRQRIEAPLRLLE